MRLYLLVAVLSTAALLSAAEYSTYIGDANDYHVARTIADSVGNTYIAGSRVLASQTSEIFVLKLDTTGKIVLFATLSGKGSDSANDLALDSAANIYIAGATSSANFPLHNPFQSTPGPGFLVKFSPDASQLLYSTYFPAVVKALAVDSAGNAYVTGNTFSPDFPVTPGLPAGPATRGIAAASGAFLTKISATGERILYSALMVGHGKDCGGGSSCFTSFRNTIGVAIALDPSGAAYIAGNTDTNDLATPGAMLTKGTGAFVAKVNAAGTALSYLTYVGPTYYPFVPFTNPANTARAIAVDASGNAYVAGSTFDPILPTTKGAYQTTYNGPTNPTPPNPLPPPDAFVVKLNPGGTGVVWATYIGGKDADVANSVALDPSGNVWVAGTTASQDFPNTQGWSQGGDFVVALNATGSSLPYAARFPNDSVAQSVAVDAAGLVHVAGSTGLVSAIAPAQPPVARIVGIANAAAGPATGRIVPGEIVAIYGPHIGPATPGAGGVQVSIGGRDAPVLYAADSQINAIVPFGVDGRFSAAVHVVFKGVTGPDFLAGVSAADPEVFRNSEGYAAAINQDGTINSPDHPAQGGSIVSIWVTGTGYEPSLDGREGQVAASAEDFDCCEVDVMGVRADVLYGGTAPGLVVGVVQVNFRVPVLEFFAAQPYLELTVQAGGQSSLPVRIYARQ
ncbi:MAG: SBBP repeat-containing protein [Acidobacteriia bacterium]|nr:SBBP repeat-containing protein [Terriglobia bacterium]